MSLYSNLTITAGSESYRTVFSNNRFLILIQKGKNSPLKRMIYITGSILEKVNRRNRTGSLSGVMPLRCFFNAVLPSFHTGFIAKIYGNRFANLAYRLIYDPCLILNNNLCGVRDQICHGISFHVIIDQAANGCLDRCNINTQVPNGIRHGKRFPAIQHLCARIQGNAKLRPDILIALNQIFIRSQDFFVQAIIGIGYIASIPYVIPMCFIANCVTAACSYRLGLNGFKRSFIFYRQIINQLIFIIIAGGTTGIMRHSISRCGKTHTSCCVYMAELSPLVVLTVNTASKNIPGIPCVINPWLQNIRIINIIDHQCV